MYDTVLYHHGILGQKWGVRRYQNKDGTLTSAGKKRYDKEVILNDKRKDSKKLSEEEMIKANRWVKEDDIKKKKIVDNAKNINNELNNITRKSIERYNRENRVRLDLNNMSDKEMRERINRAMLERQYNDMFAPKKVSRGRELVSEVLDHTGSALTLTASALSIAIAIRELLE